MKKITLISIIITIAFISAFTTSCTDSIAQTNGLPALKERSAELAKANEWEKTKEKVAELTQKIAKDPTDTKPKLQLATIFMSEARVTGDSYYHQASIEVLDQVLKTDPNNFEANTYKASVAMSLHQFGEAKKLAEKAMKTNPNNAYIYGVLVDINVEQGDYAAAIAMSDKMQALKPSLEAYSRASYLREINGDYKGAIDAMELAVKAGLAGSESAEWSRVTLGDLYVATGRLAEAETTYQNTLAVRPNFPNAIMGLAKVARAKKDYAKAIEYTKTAIKTVSEASFVAYLGQLYALSGNATKAAEVQNDVVRLLLAAEKEQNSSTILMKHNANRELANAYLDLKDYKKAMEYAAIDLKLRPENIDANELMAWTTYLNGDAKAALPYAEKMLRTKSMNAEKLTKAGLIITKAGDATRGAALVAQAKTVNSYVEVLPNAVRK